MLTASNATCSTTPPIKTGRGAVARALLVRAAISLIGSVKGHFEARQRSIAVEELMNLDDRLLRDLGLTPESIRAAAYGPHWVGLPINRGHHH
jgi:uncharacterized protein YjiS (DUF1127 family)